jgi:hypothetical protein
MKTTAMTVKKGANFWHKRYGYDRYKLAYQNLTRTDTYHELLL